jgi:hypothetical protein
VNALTLVAGAEAAAAPERASTRQIFDVKCSGGAGDGGN